MHCDFKDILELCGEPSWYDLDGVPRYCEFSPDAISDIYADHAAFLDIQCQSCLQKFCVAVHCDRNKIEYRRMLWDVAYEAKHGEKPGISPLTGFTRDTEQIQRIRLPVQGDVGWFSYGDPPRHGNYPGHNECLAGDTMSSIPVRVLEFWMKEKSNWIRHHEHEVDVWPEWANGDGVYI